MKRLINFLILMRNRDVLSKAKRIVQDPKSNASLVLSQDLTIEQMAGIEDLEVVDRVLELNPRLLRKELKELRKDLDK